MGGRRQYFRRSSLWHCLSSISFAATSASGSPVFEVAYPAFPLPTRALPAVQSLTLPFQQFLCQHEHFRQSSFWHYLSSISIAGASTSGSPAFDIAYPAFPLPTRALPAVQSLASPFQPAGEILNKHRQKKKEKKTWLTADILDLCGKRRELKKKRFKPIGSETHEEMNNNILRCTKRKKKIG